MKDPEEIYVTGWKETMLIAVGYVGEEGIGSQRLWNTGGIQLVRFQMKGLKV